MTMQSKQEVASPFQRRRLGVEIYIPPGAQKTDYHTGGTVAAKYAGDTIALDGFRCEARISCYGQRGGVGSQISIYNLPTDILRAIAGYGNNGLVFRLGDDNYVVEVRLYMIDQSSAVGPKNSTSPETGQAASRRTLIYRGSLINSVANMSAMPDTFLSIQSNSMNPIRLLAAPSLSFKGPIKTSALAQKLASQLNLSLENNGVETVLINPALSGDFTQQLDKISIEGRFEYVIDGNTLAIWPENTWRQPRPGGHVLISKYNGLIGVPSFNDSGIVFRSLYNPSLQFGDLIVVESETLPNGTGYYVIKAVNHHLSDEVPGGPWESEIEATFANMGNAPQALARTQ